MNAMIRVEVAGEPDVTRVIDAFEAMDDDYEVWLVFGSGPGDRRAQQVLRAWRRNGNVQHPESSERAERALQRSQGGPR
jgi:hypothetical protein